MVGSDVMTSVLRLVAWSDERVAIAMLRLHISPFIIAVAESGQLSASDAPRVLMCHMKRAAAIEGIRER